MLNVIDTLMRQWGPDEHKPMGGRVCVFGGDPIPHRGQSDVHVIESAVTRHPLWRQIRSFSLFTNMGAEAATESFRNWLLSVGNGVSLTFHTGVITVDPYITLDDDMTVKSVQELINFVYGDFSNIADRAILTLTNASCARINSLCINQFTGEERVYFATTSSNNLSRSAHSNDLYIPSEVVYTLDTPSLPPHELRLRVWCKVMLLRNLGVGSGMCNGTLMEVMRFFGNSIQVKLLTYAQVTLNSHLESQFQKNTTSTL